MADTIYDFSINATSGAPIEFDQFRGRPMLLVNTASRCGLTGQYEGLQELHERFKEQGLVVIGFPCDQFAHQEPGNDEEIEQFCKINFGVSFPITTKIDVNGSRTHPIFSFLKDRAPGTLSSTIKWNFTKFLVAPDGVTVKRYRPTTEPKGLADDIEALVGSQAV